MAGESSDKEENKSKDLNHCKSGGSYSGSEASTSTGSKYEEKLSDNDGRQGSESKTYVRYMDENLPLEIFILFP